MDVSPYFLAALACGFPAYVWAVLFRRRRQARESRQRAADCLALAVTRTDNNGYSYTTPDDGDGDGIGTDVRKTGRRAIHRDHGGTRLGRYAAGRDLRSADASALT